MEVVRWTIFEKMEGERGGIVLSNAHDFAIFKNAGYWRNSSLAPKAEEKDNKNATVMEELQLIVVKIDFTIFKN